MIIQKIELFSTPLTPDYRNVYDDYSTQTQYYNFLVENFPMLEFGNISFNSARTDKSDLIDVVVSGNNANTLVMHDYNYAVIFAVRGETVYKKFAFVVDMETTNSGENGAVKLKLKLDSWSNHYLVIKQNYTNIDEIKCTYDDEQYPNYPGAFRKKQREKVYYLGWLGSDGVLVRDDPKYIPLWQLTTFSDRAYYELMNYPSQYLAMTILNRNGYHCGYNFVGVLKVSGDNGIEICNYDTKVSVYKDSFQHIPGETSHYEVITGYGPSGYIRGSTMLHLYKTDSVLASTVTANVPFRYNITVDEQNQKIDIVVTDECAVGAIVKVVPESGSGKVVLDTSGVGNVSFSFTRYVNNGNKKIDTNISTSTNVYYDLLHRYDRNTYFRNGIITPMVSEYPFAYVSISTPNTEIDITGTPGKRKLKARYECSRSMIAHIGFVDEGDTTIEISLESWKNIPVVQSPLDEYLYRNQNSIFARISGSIAKFAATGGNINTGVNSFIDIFSESMKQKDLANIPNVIRNEGNYIFDVYSMTDIPFVKLHNMANAETVLKDLHINGCECNFNFSITGKRRDIFDIDTGKAEIASKMSNTDKEELISAFANGVTRWHLGEELSSDITRAEILRDMDRTVTNYPISIIP